MSKLQQSNSVFAYFCVTIAYWAFMLSDGALRMLVLLHFHQLGFRPVELAYLFVLYEFAGVVTNLSAGWIAARFGLTFTLYSGLGLQIFALFALTYLGPEWTVSASVIYVMAIQGLSGIAKDLAKTSAKSAVKILSPSGDGLFRWVAILTGSKNAIKGFGFFVGAIGLALVGFDNFLRAMALFLFLILVMLVLKMPKGLATGKKGVRFSQVFSKNKNINRLSLARLFLFGARDVWFVVGIPIYFYSVWSDGSVSGNKAAFFMIGSFMAIWVIWYGVVQANAHKLFSKSLHNGDVLGAGVKWLFSLANIPILILIFLLILGESSQMPYVMVVGLLVFGALFAVNSSLHSYLILEFSDEHRVSMDVGFYYMSNAAGRLIGTLLSGFCYQLGGIVFCFIVCFVMLLFSYFTMKNLAKVS